MKLVAIVNPHAGRGRTRRLFDRLQTRLDRVEVFQTAGPGHATELGREAAEAADVVCIVGGDGTVHEVVNGLMPSPVPIVVVPAGSGNDFARLVGCPQSADELFRVIDEGFGARLDVIDCGIRFCVNSVGLGFEAQVTRESRAIRRLKGLPLYLLAVARALASFSCPEMTIRLTDGETHSGPHLLVSVGNGVSAGGGFFLTPDARPDDGLIDACVVEGMGRLRMLRLLPLSLKGTHVNSPEVTMRRTPSVAIECAGPLPLHIDGEYMGDETRSIRFSVLPAILPVLCKKEAPTRLSRRLEKIL
jgi:diacylglycerol kinase (ATP)